MYKYIKPHHLWVIIHLMKDLLVLKFELEFVADSIIKQKSCDFQGMLRNSYKAAMKFEHQQRL